MATVETSPPEAPLPDDEMLYEVVNGQIVEKLVGTQALWIASNLAYLLGHFARTQELGTHYVEMLFLIDRPTKLRRRPDLAFVSRERHPIRRKPPDSAAWDMVPDLAVEIISPWDKGTEILTKLEEYFRAGVRVVWLIWPDQAKVYVYDSPTSTRILQVGDDLDGGAVVPGFRLPVATLFADETDGPGS